MKFDYKGKQTMAFTLIVDHKNVDVILGEGSVNVELPEENEHIKGLVSKGYLKESEKKSNTKK